MKRPDPPGLVIRYNYLWYYDKIRGLAVGDKDRPCAIVIASRQSGAVTVVPIIHSYPDPGEEALSIEVPCDVAKEISLDDDVNDVKLEVNRFERSGDHSRPLPNDPNRVDYGMLPKEFFIEVRKRLADLVRSNLLRQTKR